MPYINITPSTRIVDLQAPVRYMSQPKQKTAAPTDDFAIGTPRGLLEDSASLALQSAKRLEQINRFDQCYRSLLMQETEAALLQCVENLIAIAKGMR